MKRKLCGVKFHLAQKFIEREIREIKFCEIEFQKRKIRNFAGLDLKF